jgi:hypothetical protein
MTKPLNLIELCKENYEDQRCCTKINFFFIISFDLSPSKKLRHKKVLIAEKRFETNRRAFLKYSYWLKVILVNSFWFVFFS